MDESQLERRGTCKLCGLEADLTRTHVPARAADNSGTAQRGVEVLGEDGVRRYGLGRELEGGMWGRWFCEPCNNATGRWDEEYLRWREDLLPALHRLSGNGLEITSTKLEPGSFVRCLWAWGFALSDNLRQHQRAVADAVITGDPVEPPRDHRMLLAATREQQSAIFVLSFSVNVTAPPFVVSLVTMPLLDQIRLRFGTTGFEEMTDVSDWLRMPARTLSPVQVNLPVVHTFEGGDLPPIGQPVFD